MSIASAFLNRSRDAVSSAGTLVSRAGRAVSDQLTSEPVPLADPPPGSGLRPVMGDPGLPFLGLAFDYFADPVKYGIERAKRYGPVSWGRLFGVEMVGVFSPEGIESVLVNRDKAYANGPGWEYFIGPFFERGLMLLDFEEHLHHRRIMQQAFTRDRLTGYLKGMNAVLGDG
ncbi:MAG TPA: cytochrome P450, partial [Nitriliruptorales bacterium]